MNRKPDKKPAEDYAICPVCARSRGADWPKDHAATFWHGDCDACMTRTSVCAASDWQWPRGKGPRAGREW